MNYTSYDGFISSYSNNFREWKQDTKDFTDYNINTHYLGSILHFICFILDINENDLYYDVMENISIWDYLINEKQCYNTPNCDYCKKFIEDPSILASINKYKNIMNKYPNKILCKNCIANI